MLRKCGGGEKALKNCQDAEGTKPALSPLIVTQNRKFRCVCRERKKKKLAKDYINALLRTALNTLSEGKERSMYIVRVI